MFSSEIKQFFFSLLFLTGSYWVSPIWLMRSRRLQCVQTEKGEASSHRGVCLQCAHWQFVATQFVFPWGSERSLSCCLDLGDGLRWGASTWADVQVYIPAGHYATRVCANTYMSDTAAPCSVYRHTTKLLCCMDCHSKEYTNLFTFLGDIITYLHYAQICRSYERFSLFLLLFWVSAPKLRAVQIPPLHQNSCTFLHTLVSSMNPLVWYLASK